MAQDTARTDRSCLILPAVASRHRARGTRSSTRRNATHNLAIEREILRIGISCSAEMYRTFVDGIAEDESRNRKGDRQNGRKAQYETRERNCKGVTLRYSVEHYSLCSELRWDAFELKH